MIMMMMASDCYVIVRNSNGILFEMGYNIAKEVKDEFVSGCAHFCCSQSPSWYVSSHSPGGLSQALVFLRWINNTF